MFTPHNPPRHLSRRKRSPNRLQIWLQNQPDLAEDYDPAVLIASEPPKKKRLTTTQCLRVTQPSSSRSQRLDKAAGEGEYSTRRTLRALKGISGNRMPNKPLQSDELPVGKPLKRIIPLRSATSPKKNPIPTPTSRSAEAINSEEIEERDMEDDGIEDKDESYVDDTTYWQTEAVMLPPASNSSSQRRLGSPSKGGDFRLTHVKLQYIRGVSIPALGQQLWDDMEQIGLGCEVFPAALKDEVMQVLGPRHKHPEIYFASADGTASDTHRVNLSTLDVWTRAEEIHEAALECGNKDLSEAAWNDEVNSRLLNLSLRSGRKSKKVWYRNVTSAKITDKSLLDRAPGSKMVDYCIIIDSEKTFDTQLEDVMMARGISSISHSDVEYLRFNPIGVSIEVKRALIDEKEAEMQLATWVKAHYAKLRQMVPLKSTMPVLPLVSIQGYLWSFMLAEIQTPTQIVIHKELTIGKVDTMLGIFQVLAAMSKLADWVATIYKPWFLKQVLGKSEDGEGKGKKSKGIQTGSGQDEKKDAALEKKPNRGRSQA